MYNFPILILIDHRKKTRVQLKTCKA